MKRSGAGIALLASAVVFCFGTLPARGATFTIANGNVAALISAITTANTNNQDDTINLAAGGSYVLTAMNNNTEGPNGLPVLRTDSGHTLTINGNRTTIMRSTAANTPDLRIFQIAGSAIVTLSGVTITNGLLTNTSAFSEVVTGGGIQNHGMLTLLNSTLSNNNVSNHQTSIALSLGGGIYNDHGTVILEKCTVTGSNVFARSDNGSSADAEGGGIYNFDGIVKIKNCTFSSNFASASSGNGMMGFPEASGGGIFNVGSDTGNATVTISSSTFSGNGSSDGDIFGQSIGVDNVGNTASITIGDTILSFTTLSNASFSTGMIVSNGYNLADDNGGGFLTATGDQINQDAHLAPLRDNGGFTKTHALLPGSPAIDKGKRNAVASLPVTTDQRGLLRPFDYPGVGPAAGGDGSDIGAFETKDIIQGGPIFTVTKLDDHDDTFCGSEDCTLREAITTANAHAGSDTIRFASNVAGTVSLTQPLPNLTSNITLQGPGAINLNVGRSAGGDYRIFTISNGTTTGPVVTISGLTILNGKTSGSTFPANSGAGIYNDHGTLTVNYCHFVDNAAPGSGFGAGAGGAIYNNGGTSGHATLTVNNTSFANNTSGFFGGGICNDGTTNGMATATLTNCTLYENISNSGGGIANLGAASGHASLFVRSATFASNMATFGRSFYLDATNAGSSALIISNTILNAGGNGENFSVNNGGVVNSQGHNISNDAAGGGAGTTPGGFLNGSGDKRNTDPLLDLFPINDGGPTLTIALLMGSPAINNALNAPARDQRNFVRNGAADIGASEFGGSPAPATDFNLDAMTDYVLFNASSRTSAIWFLHGTTLAAGAAGPTLPAGWQLAAVADFDHSGGSDYVLFNATTRQTAIWFFNTVTFAGASFGPTLPPGWQLVTTADIDRDSNPDYILFDPATRHTAVWFLAGTAFSRSSFGPTILAGWNLISAIDFNANGKPDYLLFNPPTRKTAVWFLSGTTLASTAFGPTLPAGFMLSGASEFNGNGKPDYVLVNSSTRQTAIWLLNGLTFSSAAFGPTLPSGFSLAAP